MARVTLGQLVKVRTLADSLYNIHVVTVTVSLFNKIHKPGIKSDPLMDHSNHMAGLHPVEVGNLL